MIMRASFFMYLILLISFCNYAFAEDLGAAVNLQDIDLGADSLSFCASRVSAYIDGTEQTGIQLNDKPIVYSEKNFGSMYLVAWKFSDKRLKENLLVATNTGGSACPYNTFFILSCRDGEIYHSPIFRSCPNEPKFYKKNKNF